MIKIKKELFFNWVGVIVIVGVVEFFVLLLDDVFEVLVNGVDYYRVNIVVGWLVNYVESVF